MALLQKILIDDAVLWRHTGRGLEGPTYSAPVALKVRWENQNRSYTDEEGIERFITAKVFTGEVVVAPGDVLWEGKLARAPAAPPQRQTVLRFQQVKNARGTKVARIAYLGTPGG